MAVSDTVKIGLEGRLYVKDATSGDGASGSATGWTEIGYVQGFRDDLNTGDKPIYNRYTVNHWKKGRAERTFSVGTLYRNSAASLEPLVNTTFHMRLDVDDDGLGVVTEKRYYSTCRITKGTFDKPEVDEMTTTFDGAYSTRQAIP